jgi:hypothetical protein
MTLKSSMLVELLTQPAPSKSSDFVPGFFYLTRFVREDGYPIAALALRTGSNGEGTVTLALLSDEDGTPKEVLFKTELGFPQSKDPDVAATLIAALPTPHYGSGPFWIGFSFSNPVTIPTRFPGFHGRKSTKQLSCSTLGTSLGAADLEDNDFDDKLGLPFVFAVIQGEG